MDSQTFQGRLKKLTGLADTVYDRLEIVGSLVSDAERDALMENAEAANKEMEELTHTVSRVEQDSVHMEAYLNKATSRLTERSDHDARLAGIEQQFSTSFPS